MEESLPPSWVRWAGFALGPLAAAAVWWFTAGGGDSELTREGAAVLALMAWMACWWLTQAVELATTALLPIVVFPVMGVTPSVKEAAAPFANEVIFLFAGGCLLAQALERHGLSRRLAMGLLSLAGPRPTRIVGALMLASAIASAFVSNTATAAMMLPLALAATAEARRTAPEQEQRERRLGVFTIAALLGVAYGASIGGVLTIIGTPPNAIAAQLLRDVGVPVTFLSWLRFSVPVTAIFLPLAWLLLTRVLLPVHRLRLAEAASAGASARAAAPREPWSRAGVFTGVVFIAAVGLWVMRPWLPAPLPKLQDGGIAILVALALLAIPLGRSPSSTALSWRDAARLPWSVFILFGGGLSLADAMERHGVALWLSKIFHHLSGAPEIVVIGAIVLAIVFATELASNTAVVAACGPVLLALAPALGMPPERLVIPAAFAASWAFMMPVGTPPNAMAFASGQLPALTMARVGLLLNIAAAAILTTAAAVLL